MSIPSANIHGTPGRAILESDLPRDRVDAGVAGEKRLADAVENARWGSINPHVFYSAKIPGRIFDADAMVLRGRDVLIIDAKNWASGYDYKFSPTPDGALAMRRRHADTAGTWSPFAGGDIHMSKHLTAWSSYLKTRVTGALVIIAENTDITVEAPLNFVPMTITNVHTLIHHMVPESLVDSSLVLTLDACTWVNHPTRTLTPATRTLVGLIVFALSAYAVGWPAFLPITLATAWVLTRPTPPEHQRARQWASRIILILFAVAATTLMM
ncbi:hypothetical protein [Changpingibacter yushuensis]|uniref:hypothetical protein n=1 Tax=Changpingibacter yushuensis TaxID=2758440 RepID=UPI0015F5C584|nr:hypothetical protein [Changpingibacter yushuensis]